MDVTGIVSNREIAWIVAYAVAILTVAVAVYRFARAQENVGCRLACEKIREHRFRQVLDAQNAGLDRQEVALIAARVQEADRCVDAVGARML